MGVDVLAEHVEAHDAEIRVALGEQRPEAITEVFGVGRLGGPSWLGTGQDVGGLPYGPGVDDEGLKALAFQFGHGETPQSQLSGAAEG